MVVPDSLCYIPSDIFTERLDMLYQFLVKNRKKILAKIGRKTKKGLPQFYDYLTGELKRAAKGRPKAEKKDEGPDTTAKPCKRLKRLGYTVSQVVKGYILLSQAITEAASAAKTDISPKESKTLDLTVDMAVAEAVDEFAIRIENADCAKKIGSLSHELRNALTAATIAQSMSKRIGGSPKLTGVLERNLTHMREILDRSLLEARMGNENDMELCPVNLLDIVKEVEATADEEAHARGLTLEMEVDPELEIVTDSHFLLSALSNLVNNAIKFTKKDGTIWIRGRGDAKGLLLEVEDQCGGLPKGMAEKLFVPFTQKGADKTGLGLGLSISRQAVARIGGALTARDLPGKGCIFSISLPSRKPRRMSAKVLSLRR